MRDIIVVELPEGHSEKEIDAFTVGVRNIARAMFPNSVVTVETAETIGEVLDGVLRTPAGGGARGDTQRGEGLEPARMEGRRMVSGGSGPVGPGTLGVAQYLQGAESRSDGRTGPLRGTGDESEDEMRVGRRRGWLKPWRVLKKVGAGKHYAR